MTEKCNNCYWYEATKRNILVPDFQMAIEGWIRKCHFNPPYHNGFPTVSAYDFCKEWTPKEKTGQKPDV